MCCGEHVELADNNSGDWKSIIDDFAKQVYDGDTNQINIDLYFKTANRLADAITKGVGSFEYNEPANMLSAELKANLFQFSGAKSLTESLMFAEKMTDEDGKLKPFNKYRDDIEKIHQDYNVRYLSTEYNNALAQSQMALKWKNYEELGVEWIEIRTAGDARVRPAHQKLNGLVLRLDSAALNRMHPPFDWECRCTSTPADAPENPISDAEAGKLGKEIITNPIFENNAGKTGLVYNNHHPYFKAISGKLKELDAVKNYGFKPVDKIMEASNNFPAPIHLDKLEDYHSWWNDMIKKHGVNDTDFVLENPLGNKILFDARPGGKKASDYFRDHILRKGENRFEYAANLTDMIKQPNELWCKIDKNVKEWHYFKYYNDGAYILTVTEKNNIITAETMYKIDEKNYKAGDINKKRSGVLLYKK